MIVEFKLMLVGILWGLTNPFMEQGINKKKDVEDTSNSFLLRQLTNLKVIIPFALN